MGIKYESLGAWKWICGSTEAAVVPKSLVHTFHSQNSTRNRPRKRDEKPNSIARPPDLEGVTKMATLMVMFTFGLFLIQLC